MSKTTKIKRLRDSYSFPDFVPGMSVTGIFGDPKGRVIHLTRRSKKLYARHASAFSLAGTIRDHDELGIIPAEIPVSILSLMPVVPTARTAWL
jgi:hypothetical protein